MAQGITRKILGTGTIGAGVTSGLAAIGNAVGRAGAVDPGMHHYEAIQAMKDWHPTDLGTAALIGGAVGVGVGVYNRRREMKRERAQHMMDAANNARR